MKEVFAGITGEAQLRKQCQRRMVVGGALG
jgi:hypothetical protein